MTILMVIDNHQFWPSASAVMTIGVISRHPDGHFDDYGWSFLELWMIIFMIIKDHLDCSGLKYLSQVAVMTIGVSPRHPDDRSDDYGW